MVRSRLVVLCMFLLLPTPASPELAVWDYLVPAQAGTNDDVGAAVAVDLPWLAIGAPGAREVHLYRLDGGWRHVQTVSASSSGFGQAVAIDDGRLAVGAPNADRVHLYRLQGGWQEDGVLDGPDAFGSAIAIDGDVMAIGAPGQVGYDVLAPSGEVRLYQDDGSWKADGSLKRGGFGAETRFGAAIDIDGDRMIVGAPARVIEDEVFEGAAYVFRQGTSWIEEDRLDVGSGFASAGSFGSLVAISDGHAIAGAPSRFVDGLFYYGHLFFYAQRGASWSETQRDDADVVALAMDGPRAVLGSYYYDHTAVLERSGSTWKHLIALDDDDSWRNSDFGYAVALQGDQVFVGAPNQDTHRDRTGAVWTFIDNLAPVAVAGADIFATIDDPDGLARIAVDGRESYDPDGYLVEHQWSWGSKTVKAQTTAFFLPVGTHTLKLRVMDDKGFTDRDELQVQVKAEPRLKASFSFTPDNRDPGTPIRFTDTTLSEIGTLVAWDWDFNGDGRIDATGHAPTHRYAASGTYEARLTVHDHLGNEATATKSVRVRDASPTADAGDDIVVREFNAAGQGVATLDGTASRDPEGALRSYRWSIDGVPIGEEPQLEWSFNIGVTEVQLRVEDGRGQRDTDIVQVLVPRGGPNGTQSFNSDPEAAGSWRQIEGARLLDFEDASADAETRIAFVAWDLDGDGDWDSQDTEFTHAWHRPGTFQIAHRATDMDGASDERVFEVHVNDQAPVASFTPNHIERVPMGVPVVFFDTSTDHEDPLVAWQWDFDGATNQRQDVGHIFTRAGVHNITLTVTDAGGATATATGSVEVFDVPDHIAENWTQDEALEREAQGEDAFPLPGEPGYVTADASQDDEQSEQPDRAMARSGPWRITEEAAAPEPKLWWLWILLGAVLLIALVDQNRRRRKRR